ncbi:putative F-box protein At3g52320 [Miscanthus floridulus]|uniref:putative F-box protein At3g52320 n=1 Tax=Miscanthus floridulus TaxID=154761 RepID=UPI00345748F4
MAAAAGGGPLLPEDLVVWEILIRLPAKPLLRCRAVCRSWRRRLTSDAKFLLAHHRRQPSLPLLTKGDRTTEERRIDALDHRTGERRPVARTTGWTAANADDLNVLASCDGLLILLANGGLQICNPATRQRAPLTLLHGASCISALYSHRPSGSYRVLCCFERAEDGHAVYHVHTVGSRELRCVGEPPAPWASGDMVMAMPMMVYFHPHVVADGRIYWQPVMLPGGNGKVNNMVAFDTMAESFQQLLSPVEGPFLELFQMNSGALGLYHYGGGTADLWVLQDHGSWSWSMNHRIKLPGLVYSLLPVLDPEGDVLDVLVLSKSVGSGNLWKHVQHISGANGSLLARYEWSVYLKLSRHRFKESLVHHDFFSIDGNAGCVDEKPLFDGLSTVAVLRDDNSESH